MKQILKLDSRTPYAVFYKILMCFAYMGFWIFGLMPFTSNYLIYLIYLLLWSIGLGIACYMVIVYDRSIGDVNGLNGLVRTITFVTLLYGHLAILLDSWKMRHSRQPMHENFNNIKKILEDKVQNPFKPQEAYRKLITLTLVFTCLITLGHGLIIWTTFKTKSAASLIYERFFFSYLALQFKTLEFMLPVVHCNYCIDVVLRNLQQMGERNLQRIFRCPSGIRSGKSTFLIVLSLHQELEDEQQVDSLKSSYTRIYVQFQLLNRSYGWSLLTSTHVYFVDLVCNAYWIFLLISIDDGRDYYYALLQSACFAMLTFVLLSFLCWLCGEVDCKSRLIGCMISKLVKPLGNKRYNDLVSEFSIQTLHQRFCVTAKEFFSLNLALLGRMVAAIVTYLVILIQFMFNEEKSKGHTKLSSKNYTSAVAVIIGNISSRLDRMAVTFQNTSTGSVKLLSPAILGNRTSSIDNWN